MSLFISISSNAQTVVIPDTDFRSCLVNDYSSLMNGSQELIITNANAFLGTLECSNETIINISGIEHFTSINKLVLNNNDIVDITVIAPLTQLDTIIIFSNELEFTPDMSGFSNLDLFHANYNQFDNPPIFPTTIKAIHLGNNSLAGTYNISSFTQLEVFEVFENDISSIPGLDGISTLREINVSRNQFDTLPPLGSLTNLETFKNESNNFHFIPQLSTANLINVSVSTNDLTFEDFIPYTSLAVFPTGFTNYIMQSTPEDSIVDSVNIGENWSWTLSFDLSVVSNQYIWYKNGVPFDTTTTGTLTLNNIMASDDGKYHCEVINTDPKLSAFRIKTNPHLVGVRNVTCFDASGVLSMIDLEPCQKHATIELDTLSISGLVGSGSYSLIKDNDTISLDGNHFNITQEGNYHLLVSDDICSINNITTFNIDYSGVDCTPPSFSPNGDGNEDEFYIDAIGNARIYDKRGKMIKSLTVPSNWDGTDDNNQPVDLGLYIIIIDESEKRHVSLMR